jgi:hypothetical protein
MWRKLLFSGVTLACVLWSSNASAIAYCGAVYCAGKPANTLCACPPNSLSPGKPATCGFWTVACYTV